MVGYLDVGVHVLGFIAALIGIYFTSKPLAQTFIAILVTVTFVVSALNTINTAQEDQYRKHIYTQLMRSIPPANWFVDTIEDTVHNIVAENKNSRSTTLTNKERRVSITLISNENDIRPSPLTGIAVLDSSDYENLSLVPIDSIRADVNRLLFEKHNSAVTEENVDGLLSDLKTVYLSSVTGSTTIDSKLKKDNNGVITEWVIEVPDMTLSFNRDDLERLFRCIPTKRNLEFAMRIAKNRPELLVWVGDEDYQFDNSFAQCDAAVVASLIIDLYMTSRL